MAKKVNEALAVCVSAHKYTSFYSQHKNSPGAIEIFEIQLDENGYSDTGKYFGVGASLFAVELDAFDVHSSYYNTQMRSTDRTELMGEIMALYPNMKVKWNPDISDIDN